MFNIALNLGILCFLVFFTSNKIVLYFASLMLWIFANTHSYYAIIRLLLVGVTPSNKPPWVNDILFRPELLNLRLLVTTVFWSTPCIAGSPSRRRLIQFLYVSSLDFASWLLPTNDSRPPSSLRL